MPPEERKKRRQFNQKLQGKDGEELGSILQRLKIVDWDFVLIGDGSGSHWKHQIGWGCVSIHRATSTYTTWCGAMNYGTVNMAEMLAYLQPLTFIEASEATRRERTGNTRAVNVHIITDSEYCKNTGNSRNRQLHRNSVLWRMYDSLLRQGIVTHWHWMRRETAALNRYADRLSKLSRLLMKDGHVVDTAQAELGKPEDLNPWKP